MRNIALPCSLFSAYFLLNASIFAVEAFTPSPWNSYSRGAAIQSSVGKVSTPAVTCSMTETSDSGDTTESEESNRDVMNWFLKKPESPIFMAMVKNLSPEVWGPIKYQLDSAPVFYCGVEGVQPTDLPFPCFVDHSDAKAHLRYLSSGQGSGGDDAEKEHEKPKLDLIPMLLGDAYENAAVGHSTIRASTKNQLTAAELSDVENFDLDESFVPVFGIKTLVKSDDSVITGLTDRLYFDGAQARGILDQVKEQYDSEDETYALFAVSLTKAIEYLILDKESDFKFDFIPPASSLEHLTSK